MNVRRLLAKWLRQTAQMLDPSWEAEIHRRATAIENRIQDLEVRDYYR